MSKGRCVPPARVLVTGAAGRLGAANVRLLAARGVAVTALDRREPEDTDADRVVVGDAADPDVVSRAMAGVDAVVHLAAFPSPNHASAADVFSVNSRATFATLDAAARAGVHRAVIASSYSILGLVWGPGHLRPAYVPVDTGLPLQVADPYALSKQADEATAAMICRRYGITVTALRFPYTADAEVRLPERAEVYRSDPGAGRAELWSYLDERDAARACWAGLTAPVSGMNAVFIAAPDTLAPYPTEDLLDAYLPEVPRHGTFPGREVPIDRNAAGHLLGFHAKYPWPQQTLPLPGREGTAV